MKLGQALPVLLLIMLAHGFVAGLDATLVEQVLDVPQQEREADVEHHRQTAAVTIP